jgi:hypothetical protein
MSEQQLGHAIHYAAVVPGTAVLDSEGVRVGVVRQVVDNYREHILDGVVIEDEAGTVRFIDGPEVSRTFERGVLLSIDAAAVAEHGPPEDGPGVFGTNRSAGRLGGLLGRVWKRR